MNSDPGDAFPSRSPYTASRAALQASGRAADRWVATAAVMFVLLAAGGYFYRAQRAPASSNRFRLLVMGPSSIRAGAVATYTISTTSMDGEPLPARIEAAIVAPDGKRLRVRNEPADDRGNLQIIIPDDLPLPPSVKLKVVARHGKSREEMESSLLVRPTEYVSQIELDKPLYRPGETVYYRSLTLSRFGLEAPEDATAHFEIRDPKGAVVQNSPVDAAAQRGIASGALKIPADQPAGRYTLVCRTNATPRDRSRHFFIGPYELSKSNKTPNEPATNQRGTVEATFCPEGGALTPDLENRIYFAARDARGRPLQLSGTIVAKGRGEEEPGEEIASVETVVDGRGVFSLIPREGETYRLKVARPAGVKNQPALPDVSAQRDVVLSVGQGVYAAGEPLALNIRASKPGRPLVAAAYCRGVEVAQQRLVTRSGASVANPLAMSLPDIAAGVMRLVVYDYSISPPVPIAERLVYRQPLRKLNVQAADLKKRYAPGEQVEASLIVTNERGEPAHATLTVAAVNDALWKLVSDAAPAIPVELLALDELEDSDVSDAECLLSDGAKDGVPAAVALDLLLATQEPKKTSRRKGGSDTDKVVRAASRAEDRPPLLFDSMKEISAKHDGADADRRGVGSRTIDTLFVLGALGAIGLILLVAMLGLLRIATGVQLWIAAILAVVCCAIVGDIVVATIQRPNGRDLPVAFVSNVQRLAPTKEAIAAESPKPPKALPRVTSAGNVSAGHLGGDGTLFWNPALTTGRDGKAPLRFRLPSTAGNYRLLIGAFGDGRLGSTRQEITVTANP